ncbi:hypothetical protein Bca52824_040241, partial [Brassica carinata]
LTKNTPISTDLEINEVKPVNDNRTHKRPAATDGKAFTPSSRTRKQYKLKTKNHQR